MNAKNMQEEFIDMPFIYRGYSKVELAQLYVPNRAKSTAMKTFNKWLRHHRPFWRRLQRSGVDINTQIYSPTQVAIIVDHLGEP